MSTDDRLGAVIIYYKWNTTENAIQWQCTLLTYFAWIDADISIQIEYIILFFGVYVCIVNWEKQIVACVKYSKVLPLLKMYTRELNSLVFEHRRNQVSIQTENVFNVDKKSGNQSIFHFTCDQWFRVLGVLISIAARW